MRPWLLLATVLPAPAVAQTPFQVTITNTSAAAWDPGVLAILPTGASPNALLPMAQAPTSGDAYDSYTYMHASCDPAGEDDGNAALLISRWPGLTAGVDAFATPALAPGTAAVFYFTAAPGDVMSFVARATASGDDGVVMTTDAASTDTTVDLFDFSGAPLTTVSFAIRGVDVNDLSPTGGGGGCAGTCPPSVPCYVAPGGNAGVPTAQPTLGGCVAQTWYTDTDGDGVGVGPSVTQCAQPWNGVLVGGDCNDADPLVGAVVLWYADDDDDAYGNPEIWLDQCAAPPGFVSDASDCDDQDPDNWASCASCADGDGDDSFVNCDAYVFHTGPDCDDNDAAVQIDRLWYPDGDLDGHGDPSTMFFACDPGVPASTLGDDCDDTDPSAFTGAVEVCDGDDEDCDGLVDDADPDVIPDVAWYADDDTDGFGDPADLLLTCLAPPGRIADGTDCDDADPDNWTSCGTCVDADGDFEFAGCDAYGTRPGPDCDDQDPTRNSGTTWYADVDADGFGDALTPTVQCDAPPDAVLDDGDCDDADPTAFPGAAELCDGDDEDCDGLVDDADPDVDPTSTAEWHEDADGDGAGDPALAQVACGQPPGLILDGSDCNDTDPDNWIACATCADGDADGSFTGCDAYTTRAGPDCNDADPALNGGTTWHADADSDGAGDPDAATVQCDPVPGAVLDASDCDDADPSAFPGAVEVCDGDDEDCDGLTDDADPDTDPTTMSAWHADADGDGFGGAAVAATACSAPPGQLADASDCDDADPDNWTSCAGCVDEDGDLEFVGCDAYTIRGGPDCDDSDPALNDGTTWYVDNDSDGAGGAPSPTTGCLQPPGAVALPGDCDDADPTAFPGAQEVCDGDDEDCDTLVDDADPNVDLSTSRPWYADADGDGFGDAADAVFGCGQPPGRVVDGTDCDDADPDNWLGCLTCDDVDGDGTFTGCDAYVVRPGPDCDDDDPARFPGATEVCNGVDDDCNDLVDDADPDLVGALVWYIDGDHDGWGDPLLVLAGCQPPPDTSPNTGDCDDQDPGAYPFALEVCDGVDQDCDGAVDDSAIDAVPWFLDDDGDGYGDPLQDTLACDPPADHVDDATDCDDAAPTVWPGAPELCDGLDNDCDDDVDEDVVDVPWYPDLDGDGWGDPDGAIEDCVAPPETTDRPGDCDDSDPDVNPEATEVSGNAVDEDCDGEAPTGDPGSSRDWVEPEPVDLADAGCGCAHGGPGSLGWGLALGLIATLRRAARRG